MNLILFLENLLFTAAATAILVAIGWAWKGATPYTLPRPLPAWFKIWFLTIQIGGVALPLAAIGWSLWEGHLRTATVLVWYLVMLGVQVLSESLSLRKFRSVVFVMVPYLYIPYRIVQLWEGLNLLSPEIESTWIQKLLLFEIVLWISNYTLDLSQLPRLLHWKLEETK
jgi:hypothetical protein